MVITFDGVSFKYIEKKLLDDVSFSVTDQDKIGIVGVNGTGKSTLLKLILGEENPQSGKIIKSGGMQLSYLPQEPVFDEHKTILEILLEAGSEEHPVIEYEAKSILSKLGLNDYNCTTQYFSGGQKKRLALARVLVSYADFLILDEPTNHLDNEMICWLEKYLMKWKHGLLMVTHDRYFLERICSKMLELEYGKAYLYDANYEHFLALKAERLANTEKQQQKLKSILKHEAEWMGRGVEARRTKSKSRIERFEKLSSITFNSQEEMSFSSVGRYLGKSLIELKNASKSFGDKVLFENFNFTLQRSDIVGIVGENGAGKTTLFKILMQEEPLTSGELKLGTTLKIGYFSQHLDLIDSEIRVIDYIREVSSVVETLDGMLSATDLLERFLFDSTLQYSKVKMLSGGEKRRLQLVRVLAQNPNLLILDEPTNDLDIYTIELLEDYIENFCGPVLIVSHDRYFLDKLCNQLLLFEYPSIRQTMDSFSYYLEHRITDVQKMEHTGSKPKKNRMPSALKKEYEELNTNIPQMEQRIAEIQKQLQIPSTEYTKLMDLQKELDELNQKMDEDINRLFEIEELKKNFDE